METQREQQTHRRVQLPTTKVECLQSEFGIRYPPNRPSVLKYPATKGGRRLRNPRSPRTSCAPCAARCPRHQKALPIPERTAHGAVWSPSLPPRLVVFRGEEPLLLVVAQRAPRSPLAIIALLRQPPPLDSPFRVDPGKDRANFTRKAVDRLTSTLLVSARTAWIR